MYVQHYVLSWSFCIFYMLEKNISSYLGFPFNILLDSCKLGRDICTKKEIIKADQRTIIRNINPYCLQFIDQGKGSKSAIPGLDPLWILNHFHYLDIKRKGLRPMILSRYAGAGSHRYPIGFSGDTIISWESLNFQPYFTATASNIGYGWWSHDIGGHMNGVKDDELAVRWVQFGVFSPIMRLHSSCNPFSGKEPWRYNAIAESIMKDFLRLRHRMIPYLYTMNKLSSRDGIPLIQPMYYHHPMKPEAYKVTNQYYFGSELIVCPITKPMNGKLGVAKFTAWLPEGIWKSVPKPWKLCFLRSVC